MKPKTIERRKAERLSPHDIQTIRRIAQNIDDGGWPQSALLLRKIADKASKIAPRSRVGKGRKS